MNIQIVYQSKYGSSARYAQWLGESLSLKAQPLASVSMNELKKADVIVYFGGLYAGFVGGFSKIKSKLDTLRHTKILLCMVGSTSPANDDQYRDYYKQNVPDAHRVHVKPFALHGDIYFNKLGFFSRWILQMPKRAAEQVPPEKRTADDIAAIENFGHDVIRSDRAYLDGVIAHIRRLQTHTEV